MGQNGVRKFFFKLNPNTNVEETKMSPEFTEGVERYDQYKAMMDDLVLRLESCLQQNPQVLVKHFECEEGESPLEKLANSLPCFQTYLTSEQQLPIMQVTDNLKKVAAIHRQYQHQTRKAIRYLRHFSIIEHKKMVEERNKLNKCRQHMDFVKYEVKTAKTTEQIEKKAVEYEQAVAAFDAQATVVLQYLEKLPNLKLHHARGVSDFFEMFKLYNDTVVKSIPQL
ncbi:Protein F38A5.6 [Aphelenchoides besseyi]|nr:Protein F38A5.6 [Aphelenchoides besseyi]